MQLRLHAATSDDEGNEEGFPHAREYNDLYRNSLQGARELGSQRWAQSVTDVFENFHYSNQTFRNLVSRAAKEIQDPANPAQTITVTPEGMGKDITEVVTADTSAVDENTPGTYEVTYTGTDQWTGEKITPITSTVTIVDSFNYSFATPYLCS